MSNFASGNDPEERIAERDDQLAEPKRPAQVLQASPSRVGSDGVTVHTMPGVVFSFGDAQLGRWTVAGYGGTAKGTALHLRCGEHRFVLGGRDYRIGTGTPLEAVAVDAVDAWMWASEFDELLSIVGLRSGLELTLDASGGYADDACPGRGHPELATTDDRMCRFD
jgi:hypothetical protein